MKPFLEDDSSAAVGSFANIFNARTYLSFNARYMYNAAKNLYAVLYFQSSFDGHYLVKTPSSSLSGYLPPPRLRHSSHFIYSCFIHKPSRNEFQVLFILPSRV